MHLSTDFKAVQDDAGRFVHGFPHALNVGIQAVQTGANQHRIVHRFPHSSTLRSVPRQQASLSISAPVLCIGKFAKERTFGSVGTCNCQPNEVCRLFHAMARATLLSDQRRKTR